jgi:HEAT repeat protein
MRAAAAEVLARVDDVRAEERLLALVRDGDARVQTAAAVALTNPPRAIFPRNHPEFGKALDACRRAKSERAARRLSVLAAHARIEHDDVLAALVALAPVEEKAIWALAHLTHEKLETPADCQAWWKRTHGK